jgi:hypothetical protein
MLVRRLRSGAEGGRERTSWAREDVYSVCQRGITGDKKEPSWDGWKLELVKALYSPVIELILRVRGTACCNAAGLLFSLDFLSREELSTRSSTV